MNTIEGLKAFCKTITGNEPILVSHKPERWAEEGYCFRNVKRVMEEKKGAGQLGWGFEYMRVGSSGLLKAVHHQVWRSPDGRLTDVTPYPKECCVLTEKGRIWFLPDETASIKKPSGFEIGLARPSQFFPLTDNDEVKEIVWSLRRREFDYAMMWCSA